MADAEGGGALAVSQRNGEVFAVRRRVPGFPACGASIVVSKGISSAAQLKGKTLATPSLGNTQDVALRYWLKQNGIATTTASRDSPFTSTSSSVPSSDRSMGTIA